MPPYSPNVSVVLPSEGWGGFASDLQECARLMGVHPRVVGGSTFPHVGLLAQRGGTSAGVC